MAEMAIFLLRWAFFATGPSMMSTAVGFATFAPPVTPNYNFELSLATILTWQLVDNIVRCPLVEEMLFRGFLLPSLTKWLPTCAPPQPALLVLVNWMVLVDVSASGEQQRAKTVLCV